MSLNNRNDNTAKLHDDEDDDNFVVKVQDYSPGLCYMSLLSCLEYAMRMVIVMISMMMMMMITTYDDGGAGDDGDEGGGPDDDDDADDGGAGDDDDEDEDDGAGDVGRCVWGAGGSEERRLCLAVQSQVLSWDQVCLFVCLFFELFVCFVSFCLF